MFNPHPPYTKAQKRPAENAHKLVRSGRADFCCQANYSADSDLYILVKEQMTEVADRILRERERLLVEGVELPPGHKA